MINKTFLSLLFLVAVTKSLSAQDSTKIAAAEYTLTPNDVTVTVGSEVNLFINYFNPDQPNAFFNVALITPLWTIDQHELNQQDASEGHLEAMTAKAIYKAPSSVPSHNPVVITATFLASENPLDQSGNKMKFILICTIHIIDEPNFFYIGGNNHSLKDSKPDGSLFLVKEPLLQTMRQSSETAFDANGQWNIHVNGIDKTGQQLTIQANFTGNGVGSYPWKVQYTNEKGIYQATGASVFALGGAAGSIHYISTDCEPHGKDDCKGITLPGTITIKTFDTKNKIMRGYFYGQMRNGDQYMFVSGGFSVFMQ